MVTVIERTPAADQVPDPVRQREPVGGDAADLAGIVAPDESEGLERRLVGERVTWAGDADSSDVAGPLDDGLDALDGSLRAENHACDARSALVDAVELAHAVAALDVAVRSDRQVDPAADLVGSFREARVVVHHVALVALRAVHRVAPSGHDHPIRALPEAQRACHSHTYSDLRFCSETSQRPRRCRSRCDNNVGRQNYAAACVCALFAQTREHASQPMQLPASETLITVPPRHSSSSSSSKSSSDGPLDGRHDRLAAHLEAAAAADARLVADALEVGGRPVAPVSGWECGRHGLRHRHDVVLAGADGVGDLDRADEDLAVAVLAGGVDLTGSPRRSRRPPRPAPSS